MNYKSVFMNFHKTFLESNEVIEKNKNKPLAVLKYTVLESLYNMYSIFMHPLRMEKNISAATDIANIIKNIVNNDSQSDIMDILVASDKETFSKINTDIFVNDYSYTLDDIYIEADREEQNTIYYDFSNLKNDIVTSKKRVNIFRYDVKDRYRPVCTNIRHWMNLNNKVNCETYMFISSHNTLLDIFNSENNVETYKINEANYLMCGDKISFKFDTDFDIAFYNACFGIMGNQYSPEQFRDGFYFANSRVKNNNIIVVGLHRAYATYSNLEFLSLYLENINVYKDPDSNYFLIAGNATKRRQKNIKELFSIIEQICCIDVGLEAKPTNKYYLNSPDRETDIIFKSTYLDMDYTLSKLNANSAFIEAISKDTFNKLSKDGIKEDSRQPLIPFNPGQLGLVLVSGDINGAIDEGDGHYHVIRGTVKRVHTNTFQERNENTVTTKSVNSITTSVEVMLADGTCLRLG